MEAPLRSTQADRRPKRHDYSAFNVVNSFQFSIFRGDSQQDIEREAKGESCE